MSINNPHVGACVRGTQLDGNKDTTTRPKLAVTSSRLLLFWCKSEKLVNVSVASILCSWVSLKGRHWVVNLLVTKLALHPDSIHTNLLASISLNASVESFIGQN